MVTYERYLRLDEHDPRREMAEKTSDSRIKTRIGWRNRTKPLMQEFQGIERAPRPKPTPPWRRSKIEFQRVELEKRKSEYSEAELKEMSTKKIGELQVEYKIYTDGSTNADQENGGAGLFVTSAQDEELHRAFFPAGKMCSSFQSECVAMQKAIEWMANNKGDSAIITDSLSMMSALEANEWKNNDFHLTTIKNSVELIESRVILLWIPSHCDVRGNEVADQLANRGAKESQAGVPVSEKIMKARIRRRKWTFTQKSKRVHKIYQQRRKPKIEIEKTWPRKVRTAYSRLRTGHSKLLAQYRYYIDKADSPDCKCGEGEETIEHLLCECKQLEAARRDLKLEGVSPDRMVTEPDICRQLLCQQFPELKLGTGTTPNTSTEM